MNFIQNIFAKLERHPKRIVFPDGTDPRVIWAASELATRKLGVGVLLGKKEEIEQVAATEQISLNRVLLIDPSTADDLPLFVKRLETLARYKGMATTEAHKIVATPNYFAAMMLSHGQVDGLVGGAQSSSGGLLRPLFQIIKPLPGVKLISSCMIMEIPDCVYGEAGVLAFADCGVVPNPNVEQLAFIATETAKAARQLSGKTPRVAMLSYSTKGSAQTTDTEKIVAATALAKQRFMDQHLDIEIDGELQVDAALDPVIGAAKAPGSMVAGRANVLIFPDLNSGNIATKLVQRLTKANAYGQLLLGLDKPAGDVSRGSSRDEILGLAALVGLQAIEYRKLYPEQGARFANVAE
jgi:phosphate acetyltransferase